MVFTCLLLNERLFRIQVSHDLVMFSSQLVKVLHLHAKFDSLSRYDSNTFLALTDYFDVLVCNHIGDGGVVVPRLRFVTVLGDGWEHRIDRNRHLVFTVEVRIEFALSWANTLATHRYSILTHCLA